MSGGDLATILGAMLAGFAALLGGFYAFANGQMKLAREERKELADAFSESLAQLGSKIEADVEVGRELVKETRKGNKAAEERNGHLGEQNVQIIELITKHNEEVAKIKGDIIDSIKGIGAGE